MNAHLLADNAARASTRLRFYVIMGSLGKARADNQCHRRSGSGPSWRTTLRRSNGPARLPNARSRTRQLCRGVRRIPCTAASARNSGRLILVSTALYKLAESSPISKLDQTVDVGISDSLDRRGGLRHTVAFVVRLATIVTEEFHRIILDKVIRMILHKTCGEPESIAALLDRSWEL